MKNTFKLFILLLLVLAMTVFTALPVFATEGAQSGAGVTFLTRINTSQGTDNYGRIRCEVEVPEGFDEFIILSLRDNVGASMNFTVLPESDYILVEEAPCGVYFVSGYVSNDTLMEYVVLRDQDYITVKDTGEVVIRLTVTGGPQKETEATETTQATEPEESQTDETQGAPDDPTSVTEPEPTESASTEATHRPTQPTSAFEEPDPIVGGPEKYDPPLWQDIAFSIAGTGVFIGIVIFLAKWYRKFRDKF